MSNQGDAARGAGHTPRPWRVGDLCRPGQTVGISDAVDIITDCWNAASAAIAKAEGR